MINKRFGKLNWENVWSTLKGFLKWFWPALIAYGVSQIFYSFGGLLLQYFLIINIFGTYVAYQVYKHTHPKQEWMVSDFSIQASKKKTWFERLFPDDMLWIWLLCLVIKLSIFLSAIYMFEHHLSVSRRNWIVETFNITWWDAEGLCDFPGDYIMFRQNFLNGSPLYSDAFKGRYLYPPLFFYLINIFSYWTVYSAPIVMLICNMGTGYFLFHLVKQLGVSGRNAKWIMLMQLLSPINLFYSDFIWQNAGVFTTFIVWSMLAISRDQYKKGLFLLGIAISIKQVAGFFLPAFLFGIAYLKELKSKEQIIHKWKLIEYLKSIPWTICIQYAMIPVGVFFVISIPYIFTIPELYLGYLLGGINADFEHYRLIFGSIVPITAEGQFVGYFPNLRLADPANYYKVNYRTALDVAIAWVCYLHHIPPEFGIWFSFLFHINVFFFASLALVFLIYWILVKNRLKQFNGDKDYYWMMWFVGNLLFFACLLFVEKGIYKYYLMTLTPFWATFPLLGGLNHANWRSSPRWINRLFGGGSPMHVILTFGFEFGILLVNKWLAVLWVYLPLFILAFIQLWFRLRANYYQTNHFKVISKIFKKTRNKDLLGGS